MENTDEPLIPEASPFSVKLPESRGLVVGGVLLTLSVVLGFVLRTWLASPIMSEVDHLVVPPVDLPRVLVYAVWTVLMVVVPSLTAVVMMWIAFVRGQLRDRYLWSAVMILSIEQVAPILNGAMMLPPHRFLRVYGGEFVNQLLIAALFSWACTYLVLAKSADRTRYAPLAVVGLFVTLVVPAVFGELSWATTLCSALAAMGFWAIGGWIADRVGYDVYAPDSEEA
jgi:hypothetical protein